MIIPLRKKYTVGKLVGYRSNHNDGTRRRKGHKVSDAMKKEIAARQPRVVLVVNGATGKRRFVKESK